MERHSRRQWNAGPKRLDAVLRGAGTVSPGARRLVFFVLLKCLRAVWCVPMPRQSASTNPDDSTFDPEESYGRNPPMTAEEIAEEIAKSDATADKVWRGLYFARRARDQRLEDERRLRERLEACEVYLDHLVKVRIERSRKSWRPGDHEDRGYIVRTYDDCIRLEAEIRRVERLLTRDYEGKFRNTALIKRLEEESALYDMEAAEVRGLRALEEDD